MAVSQDGAPSAEQGTAKPEIPQALQDLEAQVLIYYEIKARLGYLINRIRGPQEFVEVKDEEPVAPDVSYIRHLDRLREALITLNEEFKKDLNELETYL